jgi:hypothetical protein
MIGNATMDIVKTAGQKMVRSFFELMSLSLGSRKEEKLRGRNQTFCGMEHEAGLLLGT